MKQDELNAILDKHAKWLRGEDGGNRAILRGADLCGADLCGADLRGANLYGANLCGANLYGANLCGAGLYGAKNLVSPIACPEKGSFIGWKKCRGDLIVELEICADAKRSSAAGRKCRCDKAKVLSIAAPDGSPLDCANSSYDLDFVYRVGEIVSVPDFDDNRWNECAPGIHFFISRQEAVDYT